MQTQKMISFNSSALLFFLLAPHLVAVFGSNDFAFDTEWTDGESRTLLAAESEIDKIMVSKVSSKNESKQKTNIVYFPLQNLHFNTTQGLYVSLTNMGGMLVKGVEVTDTATSLRDRRTRLRLLVPLVKVQGHSIVQTGSYEGSQAEVAANFSLTLDNIVGKGFAALHINPSASALRVSRVLVDYERRRSDIAIKPDAESDNELSNFMQGSYFKSTVVTKLWRDLSFQLNSVVKSTMTTALARYESRGPLAQLLSSTDVAEKLQQSEITNTQNANNLLDKIIKAARGILIDRFQDQVPIPNIERYFERKILFVLPLQGHFLADEGTARGLSTAFREGDTAYLTQNRNTHFYGAIAFTDLNLYYNHYEAKFIGIGPTGILNTKLHPITIQVHIHIDWESRKIYLDEFKVEHLGDLQVEITGLSVFNWLFSKITTWVVGYVRDKVVDQLETKYQDYIREVLSGVSVDDIITGKAFKKN